MRWKQGRRSQNVEDRRGTAVKTGAAVGGGAIILVLLSQLIGIDLTQFAALFGGGTGQQQTTQRKVESSAEEEELKDFIKVVLGDTEDVWKVLFRQMGKTYKEPKLVIFRDAVHSACGTQNSAVGPFYCPGDHHIYIDLDFYETMKKKLGAPGDFAQAYVIAHEVGHHVQNLLGTSEKVHRARSRVSKAEYNDLSVRLELQADFFAGVWAHHAQKARQILERGDIEEAMNAARAIGDDTLQKRSRGYVTPESFTHGTSEQRMRWFRLGLETGDLRRGDTFSARKL